MSNISQKAAIDELLDILAHAREHPQMYFSPIGPIEVIHFLHGLWTGVRIFGLNWNCDFRQKAVESRGLEFTAKGEEDELAARGLAPHEIVQELFAIEMEMWQAHREALSATQP